MGRIYREIFMRKNDGESRKCRRKEWAEKIRENVYVCLPQCCSSDLFGKESSIESGYGFLSFSSSLESHRSIYYVGDFDFYLSYCNSTHPYRPKFLPLSLLPSTYFLKNRKTFLDLTWWMDGQLRWNYVPSFVWQSASRVRPNRGMDYLLNS